ncbi:hypothetical protein A5671_17690 [Mycolicibacter heraklionensis]|nr:hypothetical protein A5671_17690 [Mycolicibacter heraklionensis]
MALRSWPASAPDHCVTTAMPELVILAMSPFRYSRTLRVSQTGLGVGQHVAALAARCQIGLAQIQSMAIVCRIINAGLEKC